MTKKEIKFSVQMTVKEIYKFTMYHVYHSSSGVFGVILSIIAWIVLLTSFSTLSDQSRTILFLVAAWFIIFDPVILFFRSRGQVKRNKTYQKPLNYCVNQEGITVSQGEEKQTVAWENFIKVIETKSQFLVYSSRVHAFIFPKKDIAKECDTLRELLQEYTKNTNAKLKGSLKRQ